VSAAAAGMARCIRIWGAVCAHDPQPHYFDRVLLASRDQVTPYNQWELLLIDNASEPALASRGIFPGSECPSYPRKRTRADVALLRIRTVLRFLVESGFNVTFYSFAGSGAWSWTAMDELDFSCRKHHL
jgi:hypothetical protein